MPQRSISERVADAFAEDGSRAFGEKYLDIILQTWREVQASLRRTTISIAVLVVVFLVLAGSKKTQLAVGPLRLADATTLLALIPPIVAYLFYELIVLLFASSRYAVLRTEVIRVLHPRVKQNELDGTIAPATTLIWGQEHWRTLRKVSAGRLVDLDLALSVVILLALPVAFGAFLLHAYLVIFDRPEISGIARWGSLVVCVFCVLRALTTLVDEMRNLE